MKLIKSAILLAAVLAASCCTTGALPDSPERPVPAAAQTSGKPASRHLARLSSHLLEARRLALAGETVEAIRHAVPLLEWLDERVRIEIRLEQLTPAILDELERAGLAEESHSFEYAIAYGLARLEDLEAIASLADVSTIRPMARARTRSRKP